MNCCGAEEPLWVILPYFNFCGFKRRRELFVKFVNEIQSVKGIRVVIAEARGPAALPPGLPVTKHLVTETESRIWLKESLINWATGSLPKNWKYVAWIDADIEFLNKNWAKDTLTELQDGADVVQLFHTAVNLGPNDEALKIDKGFAYMAIDSGTPLTKNDRYGFWHPGYAWACTRRAWNKMEGLIDWAILGSADRHMAFAWIGRVEHSRPGNAHPNYLSMLVEYQLLCKNFKMSYVQGTILHYWHGRFEDRRYRERWDILTKNKYDPISDVGLTPTGLIQLTESGKRLEKNLDEYFIGRREDCLLI